MRDSRAPSCRILGRLARFHERDALDRHDTGSYTGASFCRPVALPMPDTVTHQSPLDALQVFLCGEPDVEFAVLVGSRANDTARPDSDWDIALQLQRHGSSYMSDLARMERLRHDVATILQTGPEKIDLINVPSTKLAMRELIANHGRVLTAPDSLPWLHFLQRTWRDLEDCYWEELYAG